MNRLLAAFVSLALAASLRAGTYSQNFNAATVGSMALGDGTTITASAGSITTGVRQLAVGENALQLMKVNFGGNNAAYKIYDLDPGKEIQSFDATFTVQMARASSTAIPAAGWSLNFGPVPAIGHGDGEAGFVMSQGLVIGWDIYDNGADVPSVEVFCNGISVGNYPAANLNAAPVNSGSFRLKNPVNNVSTTTIAYSATAAQVQTAMRAVSGWGTVVVTGNTGGPWTIDRGATGAYADPISDNASLRPVGSYAQIDNTQDGAASVNETWLVTLKGIFAFDTTYRPVSVHWDYNGLDVTFDGVAVFTDLPTPGFIPAVGHRFGFSARNESSNTFDVSIDNVLISTTALQPVETGGPVISEFMAENQRTLEDEDTDSSDWIEIYNGQNATVNLSGWTLTNNPANKTLWTFPSVTMAPYSFKVVYASGKNRNTPTGLLHTNFILQKEGGYLALVRPGGVTIASEFDYGNQFEDVSYGEKGSLRTLGFLLNSTPGSPANYADPQAPGGPAEDVVWSRTGGIITGATTVSITAPVTPGSVVRYTTNNTEPNTSSPIYATPINVTASTNLRARVYTPNQLPGPVSSRTFLLIDSSLTNYNASGEVFHSHLPVIVLDSFGVPVDSFNNTSGERVFRYSYAVVIDKDPITGRASLASPAVDFQGRGGVHVRGSSSAGFPQRQYSWELWDNSNRDKDASVLGMPSNSDWIIYAPYDDKTLIRNFFTYSRIREIGGGNGAGMRTKFCEVFYNQEAGQPVSYSDYRGVYVLIEKIKRGKDRVDVAKLNELTTDPTMITGGYIMKIDRAADGDSALGNGVRSHDPQSWNSAQQSYLQNFMNSFETALNGPNFANPTTGYQAYIERDTFIDQQWLVEIAKQIDGYRLSWYMYKDRGGKLKLGPAWDYNLSLSNANYLNGYVPTGWYYNEPGIAPLWYGRLHQDTTGAYPYELRHWDKYWEMRRGVFSNAAALAEIDAEAATLLNGSTTPVTNNMPPQPPAAENAVRRHYRRWPVLGTELWPNAPGWDLRIYFNSNGNASTGEIDYMKNWLTQRLAWIDDQYFLGSVIYRAPLYNQYGGNVTAGFQLTITRYTGTPPTGFSYATGTLYYTQDGSDPRGSNNMPSATAAAYSTPITLNSSRVMKSRLYNSGTGNWSPLTTSTFIVNAVPASSSNVVVSEIHYNPAAPSVAEATAGYGDNDFEYIELLNVSGLNVDLSNCEFTAGVTFDFGYSDPSILTMAPGGRVVVVANRSAFLLRYGNNPAVKIAGEFAGSLNNSGEQIVLRGANASIIADFAYGTGEPWPVAADGAGFSLVLNNPAAGIGYDNPTSWRSSATINGTPGLVNSASFAGLPNGDTDGDGLKDFFEYATGSSQTNAASRNPPTISIAPFSVLGVTDNYLRLQFRRNLAADGVNFTPQLGSDLVDWASDSTALTYVSTVNNGEGTATVTYRSTQPVPAAGPKAFMRLMVSP